MLDKSSFGFEKPRDSPGFLLWQSTVTWQRLIKKALDPYDISHAQFVVMALLLWFREQKIDVTQVLIINWSKLDKMTVSKSVGMLVKRSLLTRYENHLDTRAKTITLTEEGIQLIKKLVPVVEKVDEDFFGKLSEPEQSSLKICLRKISK